MAQPSFLLRWAVLLAALFFNACSSVPTQLAIAPAVVLPDSHYEVPASDAGLPGAGPISRFEWFRNTWRTRRAGWAPQVQVDQHALVFVGDSITHGWGNELGGSFPGVKVANRGIGGDTSRGVLIRLKEDVLALHPSGVVILIGTNDLEQGAAPEIVAGNVRLIIQALHRQDPNMPVVLCTVFPSSSTKKRPAQGIRSINEQLKIVAQSQSNVTLLDTWPLFATPAGDADPAEFPDLLHPNAKGYAKWAASLRPVLANLGLL